jgi:hypothetical protein
MVTLGVNHELPTLQNQDDGRAKLLSRIGALAGTALPEMPHRGADSGDSGVERHALPR